MKIVKEFDLSKLEHYGFEKLTSDYLSKHQIMLNDDILYVKNIIIMDMISIEKIIFFLFIFFG